MFPRDLTVALLAISSTLSFEIPSFSQTNYGAERAERAKELSLPYG